ncbi:MAG: hypothetical protein KC492_06075, partial [Myxococcales bacterium]|nr:hypothetical protein [Myxococcales bacterium]
PPAVLVDGLDKLLELSVIRELFVTNRTLRAPACVIVYTGPITLMLAPEWKATGDHFRRIRLPNLVVRVPIVEEITIAPTRVEADRARLHELVRLRLSAHGHEPATLFAADALEQLIDASGGLLRDLIHLVNRSIRSVLKRGAIQIEVVDVAAAREELRKDMEVSLNTRLRDQLTHVDKTGEPSGEDEAHGLLLWGYVLPYTNGRVWFESHPLLRS